MIYDLLIQEYRNFVNFERKYSFLFAVLCFIKVPHFRAIIYIRVLQHARWNIKKYWLKNLLIKNYGLEVGLNPQIGKNFRIMHLNGIVIGEGAVIKNKVTIFHGGTLGQRHGMYPIIHDGVTIYPGAVILGNISVGVGAIVLANSVVITDVPDYAIAGGSPARILKFTK